MVETYLYQIYKKADGYINMAQVEKLAILINLIQNLIQMGMLV